MFTHSVLPAAPSPELVEERGPITLDEAIVLFRSFPFEAEHRKRATNPDLTVPTLTFIALATQSEFIIWSADPGVFRIWVPEIFSMVDRVTDPDDVAACIELFFEADLETLGVRIIRLEDKYA